MHRDDFQIIRTSRKGYEAEQTPSQGGSVLGREGLDCAKGEAGRWLGNKNQGKTVHSVLCINMEDETSKLQE